MDTRTELELQHFFIKLEELQHFIIDACRQNLQVPSGTVEKAAVKQQI